MASDYGYVDLRREGDVLVLHADRPPANAIDVGLIAALERAVEAVADEAPRALVVQGRPGFFSAGADLKAAATMDADDQRAMVRGLNQVFLTMYGLPFPVVAAITGHAVAGGFIFALCADYRVASREGRFGVTEVKVGLPYPVAAIGIVRAELSPQAARFLALGNRLVDAAWCERAGIFDEVVEPDAVGARALAVAHELAAFPPGAYALTKQQLRGDAITAMAAAIDSDPLLERWAER